MTEGSREHERPRPGQRSREQSAATEATVEHSGPLRVERHRKADGRRLILYRRIEKDR